jgi:hypothetical protein
MNFTIGALEQRIRRALKRKGETLRRTRGERQEIDLGNYYVVDIQRNIIMQHHCNLEALGRELGVFA